MPREARCGAGSRGDRLWGWDKTAGFPLIPVAHLLEHVSEGRLWPKNHFPKGGWGRTFLDRKPWVLSSPFCRINPCSAQPGLILGWPVILSTSRKEESSLLHSGRTVTFADKYAMLPLFWFQRRVTLFLQGKENQFPKPSEGLPLKFAQVLVPAVERGYQALPPDSACWGRKDVFLMLFWAIGSHLWLNNGISLGVLKSSVAQVAADISWIGLGEGHLYAWKLPGRFLGARGTSIHVCGSHKCFFIYCL